MHEINIVPYVDVMLVLLVIFMVTAPLVTPAVIDLPSVEKASQPRIVPRRRVTAGMARYLTACRWRMFENSSMKLSKRLASRSMSCE